MNLLKCLYQIPLAEIATNTGVTIIVNLIVVICKQGTISSHFIDKVKQAMQQDIGRNVKITSAYISSIWGAYGQYINERNVGPLIDHFLQHIMAESIRLRVTVQQSKFQALTVYQTIGRAFLAHPYLAWQLVENIAPGELAKFQTSVNIVQ